MDQKDAPTPNPIEAPSGDTAVLAAIDAADGVLKDILGAVKHILSAHPDDPKAQEHLAKLNTHG